jgi:hypothetical protein
MLITPTHIESASNIGFKDAEGWDIVVHTGYAIFEWKGTDDGSIERAQLQIEPKNIGNFNDIYRLSVTAAPSSFGRFGPWSGTFWAVDGCRAGIIASTGVRVIVDLALQGKDAGLARVAFTLIIKGHLATPIP